MTSAPRTVLAAFVLSSLALAACGKGNASEGDANAEEKKAHEAAIVALKQPVATIAAYMPYAHYPEGDDKYAPKRRGDLEKSTACAANEIRYAANKARQTLETSSANATKDLQSALKGVSGACTDATEPELLAKCNDAIKALDASLDKTNAAAAAMGVTSKYPRITPDAITNEAKAEIAPFLKAKGPGANDLAYVQKRSDPKASPADVVAACQAAQADAVAASQAFDKSEEPIRLIAHTRKISMDGQCRRLDEMASLQKAVADCRKKAKTPDCKTVCGKAKNAIEDGFPAAAFTPFEKEYTDICGKN